MSASAITATGRAEDHELRFEFGKNWSRFLQTLDESRVREAEQSLQRALRLEDLSGKSFLDLGSGSGLFSLAARRLGARVHSFDYDLDSVGCTRTLRERFFPDDSRWTVERGSALDENYIRTLGKFDVVYSWGVLHHTGDLWTALAYSTECVRQGGLFLISIYNDQGRMSRFWKVVKRTYNRLPRPLRFLVLAPTAAAILGSTAVRDLLVLAPFQTWRRYRERRGMSPWHDVVDWVGGYPFQVANPDDIFDFCDQRGFRLRSLKTCGGKMGCNEFVFMKENRR